MTPQQLEEGINLHNQLKMLDEFRNVSYPHEITIGSRRVYDDDTATNRYCLKLRDIKLPITKEEDLEITKLIKKILDTRHIQLFNELSNL